MTSKHYGWQKRWTIDRQAGRAQHDTGLTVIVTGGDPRAINALQVQQQLSVNHGHNAPEMVRRLMKEVRILMEKP